MKIPVFKTLMKLQSSEYEKCNLKGLFNLAEIYVLVQLLMVFIYMITFWFSSLGH